MESNSVCNHTSENKIGRLRTGSPICLSRVLLPINQKNYKFREKKNSRVMKERENLHEKTDKGGVNCWMVDLNCNFKCDWLIGPPIISMIITIVKIPMLITMKTMKIIIVIMILMIMIIKITSSKGRISPYKTLYMPCCLFFNQF